jgi:hypothetical protein
MISSEWPTNYYKYLDDLEFINKPEFKIVFDKLRSENPHDFVKPDTWFPGQSPAKGYVWFLIQRQIILNRHNLE